MRGSTAFRFQAFALALALLFTLSLGALGYDDSSDPLSLKDRIEIFEEVWETINEKYYDPTFNGVDWNRVRADYRPLIEGARTEDEFYMLVKRMVGELRDAHTRFHTPTERRERERRQTTSAGISLFEVEGQIVLTSVEEGSEAALSGARAGMILESVDRRLVGERLREIENQMGESSSTRATKLRVLRQLLDGEAGTQITLGLLREDGSRMEIALTRQIVSTAPRAIIKRLESGIGYLKLNVWKSRAHKEVRKAMEELRRSRGLILDLRGNPGGEAEEVLEVSSLLINEKVSLGRFVFRSGRAIELWTDRHERIFAGPVAILIDEGSGSGSELFAAVLQEHRRAVVIGRQSCGCVLGISRFRKVERGGEIAVSELAYFTPNGKRLEGTGVIPDETIELKLSDLRASRDAALDRAARILREQ